MLKNEYRSDIDGLRAIAILSVLIFHIDSRYLSGGFVGVDIFFVISGFLITSILKKEIENTGTINFKNFYLRRVKRLLPAFLFTLFISLVFAIILFSPSMLKSFGGSLFSSILSISNIFFWIETDYFDVSSKLKPLLHTWSLSIEEQFYLFWPLSVLFLLKRYKLKTILIVLFITFLISILLNLIFQNGIPELSKYFLDGKSTIFFLLPFRVYEFILGAILVWIGIYKFNKKYIYDILFLLGLGLIGYSFLFFNENMLFPSLYGIVPVLGTTLLIYSGKESKFRILLTNKLSVFIGLISYSLYLVHWPIIVFWNYLDSEISRYDKIMLLFLSLIFAYVSFRLIEQPFRKKEITLKNKKLSLLVFICIPLLFITGIHIYTYDGWKWRVNNYLKVDDSYNASFFHKEFYGGSGYKKYGAINTDKFSDKNIILVGDSHALHYAKGIDEEIIKNYNVNFYTSSLNSFIYLPFFTRTTKGKEWDLITKSDFEKTISLIKSLPNNKSTIIIMSHSWVSQLKIAGIKDKTNKQIKENLKIDDLIKGIELFKRIIGNRQLVLIGQVPTTNRINLYDIFTRPSFLNSEETENYLYMDLLVSNKKLNDSLETYSIHNKKFIFINPNDIFCNDGKCQTTLDNKLLYSDSTHLSIYGSVYFIKQIKQRILNILYGEKNE